MPGKPYGQNDQTGMKGVANGSIPGLFEDGPMKRNQCADQREETVPNAVSAQRSTTENRDDEKKSSPTYSQ
jgi:hypothetical protein